MYRYAILGAGRQGLAAAYDLARFGAASEIALFDADLAAARRGARRIAKLAGRKLCRAARLDVRSAKEVRMALAGFDAALSAVPYFFNEALAQAALEARTPYTDLGGNLRIVRRQLKLDARARKAGVPIVPDGGLAPGMANVLAAYAVERFAAAGLGKAHTVKLYCGGLPRRPRPPLGYQMLFSVEGLLNEYEGESLVLRGGKLARVPTLAELESLRFPAPVESCEAFVTSGGTSTGPYTFKGRLRAYEYKTLRYPGHVEKIRALRDLGLFEAAKVRAGGVAVSPREVFKACALPRLTFPGAPDLVVLCVRCLGGPARRLRELRLDLLDFADPRTGFSAMERTTGFPAAIALHMLAKKTIRPGARAFEAALPPGDFVRELRRRGMKLRERAIRP
ncbi:MAG: saccharopine dehydrogenase NADP-binding domain-containing protein [Planctomycetota bacterium]|nr:saccharopine dehydrogenase NADP-binding domain-containing protein [Planctomycetota bacterium]